MNHLKKKLLNLLHQHPLRSLSLLFIIGMVFILGSMFWLGQRINRHMSLQYASLYTRSLSEIRSFYSSDVAARAREKGLMVSHDYKNHPGAIPIPATFSIELARQISASDAGIKTKLYSDFPFPWRKETGGAQDTYEFSALKALRANPDQPYVAFGEVDGRWSLRFSDPVLMKESCVACHNSHPDTPKNDWAVGDVRGIQEVILPLDSAMGTLKFGMLQTLVVLVVLTLIGLSILALVINALRNSLQKVEAYAEETRVANQKLTVINKATERFVPYEFLNTIHRKSILEVQLGDQIRSDMTVLFADIRSYTTLSESMTPKDNFNFINAYLARVGPIIEGHRGFVNQFYGDGLMALFPENPIDAVHTAIEMQDEIRKYNIRRLAKDRIPIKVGMGIHTGSLMLGIIGDEKRMDTGVVSDTVNTAARMEGLTKHFGVDIVVSEMTMKRIEKQDRGMYRFLGRVCVKGRKKPVSIYEVFSGGQPEKLAAFKESTPYLSNAMKHYFAKDFKLAYRYLKKAQAIYPKDQTIKKYLQNCLTFHREGVPEWWTGVEIMERK